MTKHLQHVMSGDRTKLSEVIPEEIPASESGYVRLAYVIIQKAVQDIGKLREHGIINGTRVTKNWPRRYHPSSGCWCKKCIRGYTSQARVLDLIHWFRGGEGKEWLSLLCSILDPERLKKELGLNEEDKCGTF